jgi:hypothetical protein
VCDYQPEQASPARLLALSRAHWAIENRLHYVRDVSCREDQARTRVGNAPQVLAACRNTALTLLRRMGLKIVEGFEHFAEYRAEASPHFSVRPKGAVHQWRKDPPRKLSVGPGS